MTKPFLTFYGDDFTGSTDAMESLASYGLKTVLFTDIPSTEQFAQFADCDCIGIAGSSRSQSTNWMDENLPRIFQWLKDRNAQICHYKVCSTFDSSPAIGNIGRAAEIASGIFGQSTIPLLVGVPQLKRFTFAGHLFAAYRGETFRIDRHPVMSKHPVTPMDEADLRIHLARQTSLPVTLASDQPATGIRLFDVHDEQTQSKAGEWLLGQSHPFVIGSSGVGYALMRARTARADMPPAAKFGPLPAIPRLLAVSGSLSPMTERQISVALQNGFAGVEANPVALLTDPQHQQSVIAEATQHLEQNRSVIIYTARGEASNQSKPLEAIADARRKISLALGAILRTLIEKHELTRAVIAGGDTSSHALAALNIHALTTRSPLKETPGAPLCTAYSSNPRLNGLEIAMKGGQLGGDEFFIRMRDGI